MTVSAVKTSPAIRRRWTRLDQRYPGWAWLAVALSIMLVEGYLELFVTGPTLTGGIVAAVMLFPLVAVGATGRLRLPLLLFASACLFIVVILVSALANDSPGGLILATLKVDLLPLAALVVGLNLLRLGTIIRLLPLMALLMTANALFAAWQTVIGVDGLLARGYVYAQTVRNFGSSVRAFGLLPRDNILGQVCAIFLVVAVWAWLYFKEQRKWCVWLAAAAIIALVLSHNRTAEIAAVIGVVVVTGQSQGARGWLTRAKVALALGVVVAAVAAVTTLGTLDSLGARVSVWTAAVAAVSPIWGGGPGHTGVAASTALAQSVTAANVGDNNYITVVANFGVLGVIACAPFIAWLAWRRRSARGPAGALIGGLLTVLFLGMITDNFWEEVPSALILLLFLGCALRSDRDGDSSLAPGDQRALPGSAGHRRSALRA